MSEVQLQEIQKDQSEGKIGDQVPRVGSPNGTEDPGNDLGQAATLKPLNMPSQKFEDEEAAIAKADPEKAAEERADLAEEISYAKLHNYINDNHPTVKLEEGEEEPDDNKFGICDSIGNHSWLCFCNESKISPMSQEIGVGASMFLMSAKSLAILFFFLSIINIPVFLFYWGSDRANTHIQSPQQFFNALSLGSIGQSSQACDVINWAQSSSINFSCHIGKLTDIKYIGLQKHDEVQCASILKSKKIDELLEDGCYTDATVPGTELHSAAGEKVFRAKYNSECVGKSDCTIKLDINSIKSSCKKTMDERIYTSKFATTKNKAAIKSAYPSVKSTPKLAEPWFLAVAQCKSDTVSINVGGKGGATGEMAKADFGIFVVFIDFFCVIVFIYFIYYLDARQKEYYKKYEDQTITMSDFTLEFKAIPRDGYFSGKEQVLRAILYKQLHDLLDEQYEINNGKKLSELSQAEQEQYAIVDITFARSDINDSILLEAINGVRQQKEIIEKRIKSSETDEEKAKHQKDMDKEQIKYQRMSDEYFTKYNQSSAADDGCGSCATDKVVDPENESLIRAYVTFRSMDALETINDAYQIFPPMKRRLYTWCSCCYPKQYAMIQTRYIDGHWPEPIVAQMPDQIQWQNMGYSPQSRCLRVSFVYFISFLLILGSFIGILYFKQLAKVTTTTTYVIPATCPGKVTQLQAYHDHLITNPLKRRGLMSCYCVAEAKILKDPRKVRAVSFKADTGQDTLFCKEWMPVYFYFLSLKFGAPLVIIVINLVVPIIFNILSEFEHATTKTEQTERTFKKVAILAYFNICIVILLINMNLGMDFHDGFPVLNGEYTEFSSAWFKNIGAALSFTLLVNVFTPQGSKLTLPFIKVFLRCVDRGCKTQLKNGQDGVFTKKILQSDLETLYTGLEMSAFYVYAQYFTALWSCMSYSAGMPCLYPIACLNFTVLYWVYKYLLLKQYQKTTAFDQQLCISSMSLFKYAVIMHLFFGAWFYSNSSILSAQNLAFLDVVRKKLATNKYTAKVTSNGFFTRFESGIGLLYLLFVILLFILFIFETITVTLITKCHACFAHLYKDGCKQPQKETKQEEHAEREKEEEERMAEGLEVQSNDIAKDFQLLSLQKFYNKIQEENEDFKQVDSKCFPDPNLKIRVGEIMEKRLAYVEDTINSHLRVLIYETGKDKEAELMKMPTADKMQVLLMNNETILASPQCKNALRMSGITQSYSMYDSKMFDDAIIMKEILINSHIEKKDAPANVVAPVTSINADAEDTKKNE